jgi:hypothetical protein
MPIAWNFALLTDYCDEYQKGDDGGYNLES